MLLAMGSRELLSNPHTRAEFLQFVMLVLERKKQTREVNGENF